MDFDAQKCHTYATFFDIDRGFEPYELFFCKSRLIKDFAREEHAWRGVLRPRAASRAVVWNWELTYLPRLSHDDVTFTKGKLPQIIILL